LGKSLVAPATLQRTSTQLTVDGGGTVAQYNQYVADTHIRGNREDGYTTGLVREVRGKTRIVLHRNLLQELIGRVGIV
jgi:hypothetical protein